jgi:hypothetical protein
MSYSAELGSNLAERTARYGAKDKSGNPVQMVIGPDSITAVRYVKADTRQ